jgi:hypothetical protein
MVSLVLAYFATGFTALTRPKDMKGGLFPPEQSFLHLTGLCLDRRISPGKESEEPRQKTHSQGCNPTDCLLKGCFADRNCLLF